MKSWENLTWKSYRLSTSDVATVPWEIKKSFSTVLFIHVYFWLYTLSHKKTICNPLAHPTWKCHHTNLWIAKLFIWLKVCCIFSDVGSAETSQLWVVVGGSEKNRLWCVATGMSGSSVMAGVQNDHILHYTCFQSFSTLISRIVHHAVLKFNPCRNKPLPQASTCPYQYACSSCSVPQTQY